ncbi:hypothetical protein [Asticcacaulis biprosthecium]|nr:hypothetical protein [Asticcacaulis biprosthecium]
MKIVTLTVLAAFALTSAAPAFAGETTPSAASAKTSNKVRTSDNLNQAQLQDYNQFMATRPAAIATYSVNQPQVSYVEGDAEDLQGDVLVQAPPRDATETMRQPDTSPPKTGQPAIDTPYIAVQPAQ